MEKRISLIYKVAVIGPESSGKSTLVKELSDYFKEPYTTEFAREYLQEKNNSYKKEDLDDFAIEQLEKEELLLDRAKQCLFCDTNPLSIKIWSLYKYGSSSKKIDDLVDQSHYHLNLLLKPDLPYEEDLLRVDAPLKNRLELFDLFENELIKSKSNYSIIGGLKNIRLNNAIKAIRNKFLL